MGPPRHQWGGQQSNPKDDSEGNEVHGIDDDAFRDSSSGDFRLADAWRAPSGRDAAQNPPKGQKRPDEPAASRSDARSAAK